jgi:hypothetical protein
MRKILLQISLTTALGMLSAGLWADTLIMKDGTRHEGEFVSGTSRVITFRENGALTRYGTETIDLLQFGPIDQGNGSAQENGSAPSGGISADANGNYPSDRDGERPSDREADRDAGHQQDQPVADQNQNNEPRERRDDERDRATVPGGTELVIRTSETIDSRTARADQTFAAQVDQDVLDDSGQVVIPRGADARLLIKRIDNGGSTGTPDLTLDIESVSVNGRRYLIDLSDIDEKGTSGIGKNKRTGQMVGGGAVLGTIIGAIAGGGKGAAIGAVGGAAAGAGAEVLTKGKSVLVPSETLLKFKVDHPMHLRASE